MEISKRRVAYSLLYERFVFFDWYFSVMWWHNHDSEKSGRAIFQRLGGIICWSLDIFFNMYPNKMTVKEMFHRIINNELILRFPNIHIAFRLYFSFSATRCESEGASSNLQNIKYWWTMWQDRLSSLSLLLIESDLLDII